MTSCRIQLAPRTFSWHTSPVRFQIGLGCLYFPKCKPSCRHYPWGRGTGGSSVSESPAAKLKAAIGFEITHWLWGLSCMIAFRFGLALNPKPCGIQPKAVQDTMVRRSVWIPTTRFYSLVVYCFSLKWHV